MLRAGRYSGHMRQDSNLQIPEGVFHLNYSASARSTPPQQRNFASMKYLAILAPIALAACQTAEPGIEVRTVEVVREVQKPCPGTPPVRPGPLGPLMATAEAALAQTLAKLAEYSAPGQYADQADAYVEACPPSTE